MKRKIEREEVTNEKEIMEEEIPKEAELSINSTVGINGPKTMKLSGKIKDKEVMVLIDSGTSHNFINRSLVYNNCIHIVNLLSFQN